MTQTPLYENNTPKVSQIITLALDGEAILLKKPDRHTLDDVSGQRPIRAVLKHRQ
ncbi:Uncharacterised protein [Proteus mirabilis]|uniref:Uncharacterized protein n=1 Tax=Proteus mirabilis TaxID=584 RepID=A0A2X2BSF7_PROMI|nr:Uncharacterised protein [Proteus mirabilis]